MGTLCRGQNGHWYPPVNCKRVRGRPYAVFSKDTAEGNTGEPCRVPTNIFEANVGVDLHACENTVFEAECPEGSFIAIQDASYGRKIDGSVATRQRKTRHVNAQICPGPVQAGHAGNCHLENSKDIVAAECDGKRACTIVAANDVFGADPCAGTFKLLTVRYQCEAKPITPAEMCESINLNDFSSFEVMQQVGWNTEGVVTHQHVDVGRNTDHGEMCNTGSSWWGWANEAEVGQLNVIAPMTTTARIDVGNCWNEGVVKVYVAGVQVLAAVVGEGSKVISFSVQQGDEISIRDEGRNSVMRLNSLQFDCAPTPAVQTCAVINGNDFSDFAHMQQVGWSTQGNVRHHHEWVGSQTIYGEVCNNGNDNWWGWVNGEGVGQLNVIAPITTTATIDVGNCWNQGVVKVYVAGVQVLTAPVGAGSKKIFFHVNAGDEISIRDEGRNSVMRLNSLKFNCAVPTPEQACTMINDNDFGNFALMQQVGWSTQGNVHHHHVDVGRATTRGAVCNNGNDNWWGWQNGEGVGQLNVIAPITTYATIDVGNCWNEGVVKVYVAGVEVLAAQVGEGSKTVSFPVTAGDEISIRDEGLNSVMRLNSLKFPCQTAIQEIEKINLNDFSNFAAMRNVGWYVQGRVTHKHMGVGDTTRYGAVCNTGESWWGWQNGDGVGQLNIVAPATTTATIDVGNCWNEGVVKVYVAGVEVLAAQVGEGSTTVSFPVSAGDVISIRDEGRNSVMRLNSLQFAVPSAPTQEPTDAPTASPTDAPTASPTDAPTASPTDAPTASPTDAPTASPTDAPTASPTDAPTASPTANVFSAAAQAQITASLEGQSLESECNPTNCLEWNCGQWCDCFNLDFETANYYADMGCDQEDGIDECNC